MESTAATKPGRRPHKVLSDDLFRICAVFYKDGKVSIQDIAAAAEVSVQTVYNRFAKLERGEPQRKGGRPPALNDKQKAVHKWWHSENPLASVDMHIQMLKDVLNVDVSADTVKRLIKSYASE